MQMDLSVVCCSGVGGKKYFEVVWSYGDKEE